MGENRCGEIKVDFHGRQQQIPRVNLQDCNKIAQRQANSVEQEGETYNNWEKASWEYLAVMRPL